MYCVRTCHHSAIAEAKAVKWTADASAVRPSSVVPEGIFCGDDSPEMFCRMFLFRKFDREVEKKPTLVYSLRYVVYAMKNAI